MLLKLLREYLAPYRRPIFVICVLQLLATIASLYLPSLNADIIDQGVVRGDTGYILRVGALMLGISLVQVASSTAATYFGARTAMGFGRDLRSAVFRRVGEFSAREVASFGAPSLITRNTNDVQQVQMLAMMTFTLMVMAPITMVGGIIMAIREDLGLSWLVVVAVPALAIALGFIISRMIPAFQTMQVRIDTVNRVLREQTTGIRVLRAFVREPFEVARFAKVNDELTDVSIRVGRWIASMFPVVILVLNVASVAVLWFGGLRVEAGAMQIGSLTAFLAYLIQILMAVMMATFTLIMVPRAAVCADRIGAVLQTKSSVVPPAKGVTQVEQRGQLKLQNVSHTYPGAHDPVLRDITFEARAGQTTAIIGATGAGKTTLVSLIPRLFDASSGAVLVDGIDVRDWDLDALWSKLGLVPQTAYLFSGTIASNLRYGNPGATESQMWSALEIAQAKDFVAELPGGLEAPVSQGGTNLSGGQRQRISIARALVKRPEIYLFDDSFSALDLATEARLRLALRREVQAATVLIVAQRVATIKDADQIVVIDGGAVVGLGTHDFLLKTCRTYIEIVESQQMLQVNA
ncbi:MAG TPA: ABC transporter ATP-binding protein [Steroidobacteraceae bacterium]|nr:ABC transporter ATP-binding protein [Steroidobacteraceae bacterium]